MNSKAIFHNRSKVRDNGRFHNDDDDEGRRRWKFRGRRRRVRVEVEEEIDRDADVAIEELLTCAEEMIANA